jgi:hypothetical protein
MLTAEHIFKDYQFSRDHQVKLPEKTTISPQTTAVAEEVAA